MQFCDFSENSQSMQEGAPLKCSRLKFPSLLFKKWGVVIEINSVMNSMGNRIFSLPCCNVALLGGQWIKRYPLTKSMLCLRATRKQQAEDQGLIRITGTFDSFKKREKQEGELEIGKPVNKHQDRVIGGHILMHLVELTAYFLR